MKTYLGLGLLSCMLRFTQALAGETNQISQYGITWTFDKAYPSGQFCTGDYWVVGPAKVIQISTALHAPGFEPQPGEDGSMVNPGTDGLQGYCPHLTASYRTNLNAALIGGKAVSAENPLVLTKHSSLVSMVSWLYKSPKEAEPGTPRFGDATKVPRSATRVAAVLTVVSQVPAEGSFRPPYCGSNKTVKFNVKQLDLAKLKNLEPVKETPNPVDFAKVMERPWIDHAIGWYGADIHPTENMPNYGRDIAILASHVAVMLQLDFSKLPGNPTKDKLVIELVQFGIDCTGIADAGGGWPHDGGHALGRKLPILFAGALLNDPHMLDVGHWKTRFQEDEQTFYVTQKEVDLTHSPQWNCDKRGGTPEPYTKEDIGTPEWGIRHAFDPNADNRAISAIYRPLNALVYPGMILAARSMGLEEAWNHKALFDYTDRWMNLTHGRCGGDGSGDCPAFYINMWNAYGVTEATGRTNILRRNSTGEMQ